MMNVRCGRESLQAVKSPPWWWATGRVRARNKIFSSPAVSQSVSPPRRSEPLCPPGSSEPSRWCGAPPRSPYPRAPQWRGPCRCPGCIDILQWGQTWNYGAMLICLPLSPPSPTSSQTWRTHSHSYQASPASHQCQHHQQPNPFYLTWKPLERQKLSHCPGSMKALLRSPAWARDLSDRPWKRLKHRRIQDLQVQKLSEAVIKSMRLHLSLLMCYCGVK